MLTNAQQASFHERSVPLHDLRILQVSVEPDYETHICIAVGAGIITLNRLSNVI